MARDRNYTDTPINYYQAVCHPHETINSVAPVHRRADKLSRPVALAFLRARTNTHASSVPSLLFYVHIFFSAIFAALFNDRPFNENFPGRNGIFIAPTRFWHGRWFICFDSTRSVAFRRNHPAKRQNVSIDPRTFAISCFRYRVPSVSIALPHYVKDKMSRCGE